MARETKVGLLIGLCVILLIGIIVSDQLAVMKTDVAPAAGPEARAARSADEAPADAARPPGNPGHRIEDPVGDAAVPRPVATPGELAREAHRVTTAMAVTPGRPDAAAPIAGPGPGHGTEPHTPGALLIASCAVVTRLATPPSPEPVPLEGRRVPHPAARSQAPVSTLRAKLRCTIFLSQ